MNKDKFKDFVEESHEITEAISKILIKGGGYRIVSIQSALAWWLAQIAIQAGTSKEDTVKYVERYYDDLSNGGG